jgi:hypothetical protein
MGKEPKTSETKITKKKATFTRSMQSAMDRVLQLDNPLYKVLSAEGLVENYQEFLTYKNKIKECGLKLTGKESAQDLNKRLLEKVNFDSKRREEAIKNMSNKLKSEGDL